jgi:hypothetical protein
MAVEALFLGWGPVVRGREQTSLKVFQETIEYYGRLQQEGKIDSFEEFERAVVRAGSVVDNVGVVNALIGESIGPAIARFQAAAEELA